MKTATLPALRVRPELREAAEKALRPEETLSALMEASLESYIAQRQADDEFIARGLLSAKKARASGRYVSADSVMKELTAKLTKAKKLRATSRG
jgi:predicted transcriptional regulator